MIRLEKGTSFGDYGMVGSGNCGLACMDTFSAVGETAVVALLVFVAVPVVLDVVALPCPH